VWKSNFAKNPNCVEPIHICVYEREVSGKEKSEEEYLKKVTF
jgi:hypothetical protein